MASFFFAILVSVDRRFWRIFGMSLHLFCCHARKKKIVVKNDLKFFCRPSTFYLVYITDRNTKCQATDVHLFIPTSTGWWSVLFTSNRSVSPSAFSTPSVAAPCRFFLYGEIQALWSQNHDTEILHCNAVSRLDNAWRERKRKKHKKI